MLNELNSESDPGQPMVYQIKVKSHLGREWTDWFEGLTIQLQENGETLLTGPVVDQAALYGLLKKVRDVGMPLISVIHITPGQAEASNGNETYHFPAKKGGENMKTTNKTIERKDRKVILSTLWIFATLNYIYCDVLGLMDPSLLRQYLTGSVNGIHITQGFLLGAGILVEIPMAMVLLSRVLSYRANRWANVAAGSVMTVVQCLTLVLVPSQAYYIFYSILEIACTLFIVWYAWTWTRPEAGVLTSADSGLVTARQREQEEAKRKARIGSEDVQVAGYVSDTRPFN